MDNLAKNGFIEDVILVFVSSIYFKKYLSGISI